MPATRIIICKHCRNKASIDNVRYDKDGKNLICVNCYNRVPVEKQKKTSPRETFLCLKCNYKFSISTESRVTRRCPYCSSENITSENFSATDILEEVSDKPEPEFFR